MYIDITYNDLSFDKQQEIEQMIYDQLTDEYFAEAKSARLKDRKYNNWTSPEILCDLYDWENMDDWDSPEERRKACASTVQLQLEELAMEKAPKSFKIYELEIAI